MNAFDLKILTPARAFYDGICTSLVVPTLDGLYGIQANHENLILAVIPGTLRLRKEDEHGREEVIEAAVSSGLLKVESGEVMLLVDTAERAEEIDLIRAEQEAAAAQEELLQKRSAQEHRMAQERLARSIGRIQTKKHHR